MINLTLRVTDSNGSSNDYTVGPKVQVAFEREWKVGMPKAFASEQKMEHLYWLGWKAQQSSGAVVKPFDGWLDTVESVEVVDADSPLS
jgi:hypothetical protein